MILRSAANALGRCTECAIEAKLEKALMMLVVVMHVQSLNQSAAGAKSIAKPIKRMYES